MKRSTLVVLVTLLIVGNTGTVGAFTTWAPSQTQATPTGTGTGTGSQTDHGITFDDQESSGESIFIKSATLPQQGFVVIYDSTQSGNETNQIVGASYPLSPGTSENIRIQLDEPLNGSKSLTAVIHTDSNGNDQFDYVSSNGQQDPPLTQGDRRIVDIAQVTTQTGNDTTPTAESGGAAADGASETQAPSNEGNGPNEGNTTDGDGENDSGGSEAFGPGFTLAIALVAVLVTSFLLTRRN